MSEERPGLLDAPKRRRPGSEARQKQLRITYRVDEREYFRIENAASRAGLTVASYSRSRAVDAPTTRARKRAPVDLAALATALRAFTRVAVNFNQIALRLNTGGFALPEELVTMAARLDAARLEVMAAMGRT